MVKTSIRRTSAVVCLLAILFGLFVLVNAQTDPSLYSGLRWRMVGPFRAGRVNAVAGVAGQPDTCYFGSVGGGVWKTTNAGRTWMPIFDSASSASIGAIGIAPSDPSRIWAAFSQSIERHALIRGQ